MASNFLTGFLALGTGFASFVELTGAGYARMPVALGPLVSGRTNTLSGFTFAATGTWPTATQHALYDSSGNLLLWWNTRDQATLSAGGTWTKPAGSLNLYFPDLAAGTSATDAIRQWPASTQIGSTPDGQPVYTGTGGLNALAASGVVVEPVSSGGASTGTATVTQIEANRIFQRTSRYDGTNSLGQAQVPVSLTVSGGNVQVEYQLRNVSGGGVLQSWTPISGALAPGAQTVYATVPSFLGWYYLDIRINGTTVTAGTHQFAVGELIGIAGQSLAVCMLSTFITGDTATNASLGVTPSAYSACLASWAQSSGPPQATDSMLSNSPPAWQLPGDATPYNSTFASTFLSLMVSAWGVPCGLVGFAVGATGIASWLPGYTGPGTAHSPLLKAILTRAGGAFGAFIWDQGHYESKDSTNQATYVAQLGQLFLDLQQSFPAAAALRFKRLLSTIPAVGAYGSTPGVSAVRQWARAYTATDPDAYDIDGLDVTLWSDLVHPSQAGGIPFAQHFYRAACQAHGIHCFGDTGPVISSASRAYGSAIINLNVGQTNGGTAFATNGTITNQFKVFPAGQVTGALSIASLSTASPAQMVLTLASAPTEPAALDVWYRLPPDTATIVSTGIYDNVTDGDGLTQGRQLALIPSAITIAAPATAFVVNSISNTTAGTAIAVTGTYSTTPAALDASVDGGTTWVAVSSPTISGGTFSFTLPSSFTQSSGSGLAAGAYKVTVRDHTVTTTFGSSPRFTVSPGSTYTPASTPGTLIVQFDAAAPATLWQDTAGTIPAVHGSAIALWQDASGNSNNAVQAGGVGLCPVYQTNIKNGLPGIRFTGSLLQFLSLSGATSLLAYLNTGGNYFAQVIYTPATLPSAGAVASDVVSFMSASINTIRLGEFRNTASVYHNRQGSANNNITVSTATAANQLTDCIQRFDGTTIYNAVNALTEVTAAQTGTSPSSLNQGWLGYFNNGTAYPLDGWIHEVLIYEAFGTTGNKTDLRAYGTSKWGA